MTAPVEPFDVCGPLPTGVRVLEASAGTGKTFTVTALATRYVAEGLPLEHLLVVTFTRMATGELRDRVRQRFVATEHGLRRVLAGEAPPDGDSVLALLAGGTGDEVECRRRNLADALAEFDAATISTTHGFCQHILNGLGVAGDVERDVTFVEDVGDVVEQVVDDVYVRWFHADGRPPLTRAEALRLARVAVDNPLARLEPGDASEGSEEDLRRRLALEVRAEVEARKRRAKVLTYDDLLTRLAATLDDPDRGPAACLRLRQRYRVALVDEFQDTDPIQWRILRRAFAETGATLVLIGDPKQAIYAFRGGDVYAYLEAARAAGAPSTLGVNWRSDQGLIDAYDAVFSGVTLGHDDIAYRTVRAAGANRASRLRGVPQPAPLRIRVVHRADGLVDLTRNDYVVTEAGRRHIAADLAADVVEALSSGAEVVARSPDGSDAGSEPLRPGHVAVLVRTNHQAAVVRGALDAARVPAVLNGAGSVLGTEVARDWLVLLEALERPESPARARAAAMGAFVGWGAERVAGAGDEDWEDLHARLHDWAAVLRRRGVASLVEAVTVAERLPGRLLSADDGERRLTDLRHVGELLHAEAVSGQLGVTALAGWLRRRIAEADDDAASEERSRRLESDAEAVQVLTIHRSKGLEFPVVYCPYLWDEGRISPTAFPIFHDPDAGDERTIDVGMGGPAFPRHKKRFIAEQRGEDLRLTYVALTRARHQAVVWWAASQDSRDSPLGRLVFARTPDGAVPPAVSKVPGDDEAVARFEALAAAAPGCVSVERASGLARRRWAGPSRRAPQLTRRGFDRELDVHWRRTSYSAITAAAHEAAVTSEPEDPGVVDEAPVAAPGAVGRAPHIGHAANEGDGTGGASDEGPGGGPTASPPLLLAAMPAGAEIGSFVHAVLEHVDFAAADLDGELARAVDEQQARHGVDVGDPVAVVAGLRAAIETPLGPLVGDLRLRDVRPADRLDELAFELPLVGGDRPAGALTLDAVAGLLRDHLRSDDPVAGYAQVLGDPALAGELRGYLAGSIDLVVRVAGNGAGEGGPHAPRFAVVDHKTNWLAAPGEELSAWHYRPAALAGAMQRAHYPLQALLYTAALHRYLRWRLPGYHPERNLAGVLYLFLRGMTGAAGPRVEGQPCGVFAWRPPAALVVALSDLLDRGAAP